MIHSSPAPRTIHNTRHSKPSGLVRRASPLPIAIPLLYFFPCFAPTMEYQFTRGIQRPNAARLSLALSSVLYDSLITDVQKEIPRSGIHQVSLTLWSTGFAALTHDSQELPKVSSTLTVPAKTPYSVLSSGSIYSQDSWVGPEAWAFNKPPPAASSVTNVTSSPKPKEPLQSATLPAQRGSSPSVSIILHSSDSPQGPRQTSSTSTDSKQGSSIPTGSIGEDSIQTQEDKREKKAKLKQMYKRASRSTKAFTKMFSRSPPGSSGGSPPGGVTKRSSLKTPLPTVMTSGDLLPIDPFASGSSVSSYGLSPVEKKPPSPIHKRSGSSPDGKPPLSIDVQTHLQRSPSVSSPLGIPASPSLNRLAEISGQHNIRGRDVPFPINSSNVSLSLPSQRPRSASQSSTRSIGPPDMVFRPSQNQNRPPVPRIPSNASLRAQIRQTPPVPAPERPPPEVPAVPPVPIATSTSPSSGLVSIPVKRPRSQSVREIERPRNTIQPATEAVSRLPRQETQPNANCRGDGRNTIGDGKLSFLDMPPPNNRSYPAVQQIVKDSFGPEAKHGAVRTHEVQIVAPSPSMPSMRAAFLDSIDLQMVDLNPRNVKSSRSGSEPIPVPSLPSSRDGLHGRAVQSRAANTKPSRDPSLARAPQQQTTRRPFLPQLSTQNLPPQENRNGEQNGRTSLRSQRSMRSIPRSPSLPSLRPDFSGAPPLPTLRANSHHEESINRLGSSGNSHVRSPSLPNFRVNLSSIQNNKTRQPLSPSIAERLRARGRSNSRSEERRPSVESSASRPPSIPLNDTKKPILEPIPSASLPGSTQSTPLLSGASNMQTPPSPTVSRLLRTRNLHRTQVTGLKSPSMPDLRAAANSTSTSLRGVSRSHRPPSPPPPVPPLRPQMRGKTPSPDPIPSQVQVPTATNTYKTSTNATTKFDSSPPFATLFLRPKPNLTRRKEFSYPPTKDTVQAFHARSNKELAKEGGWDFLDAPPRPPRSPGVQIPVTPIDRKPFMTLRMRSNSVRGDGFDASHVRAPSIGGGIPQGWEIGVAL